MRKGQSLGLDLVARCYSIVILKIEKRDRSEKFDYAGYQQVQLIVSGLIGSNPDIYLLKKDWEELVLLMKGNIPQYLEEESTLLLGSIKNELEKTGYRLSIGIGSQKNRITDIYQSFVEAFVSMQNTAEKEKGQFTTKGSNKPNYLK